VEVNFIAYSFPARWNLFFIVALSHKTSGVSSLGGRIALEARSRVG
jgi:hypothetical protein